MFCRNVAQYSNIGLLPAVNHFFKKSTNILKSKLNFNSLWWERLDLKCQPVWNKHPNYFILIRELCFRIIKAVLSHPTVRRRLMEANRMRFWTPQGSLSWCFKARGLFSSNYGLWGRIWGEHPLKIFWNYKEKICFFWLFLLMFCTLFRSTI